MYTAFLSLVLGAVLMISYVHLHFVERTCTELFEWELEWAIPWCMFFSLLWSSNDDFVESLANMLKVPTSRIDFSNRPHNVKMALRDKLWLWQVGPDLQKLTHSCVCKYGFNERSENTVLSLLIPTSFPVLLVILDWSWPAHIDTQLRM